MAAPTILGDLMATKLSRLFLGILFYVCGLSHAAQKGQADPGSIGCNVRAANSMRTNTGCDVTRAPRLIGSGNLIGSETDSRAYQTALHSLILTTQEYTSQYQLDSEEYMRKFNRDRLQGISVGKHIVEPMRRKSGNKEYIESHGHGWAQWVMSKKYGGDSGQDWAGFLNPLEGESPAKIEQTLNDMYGRRVQDFVSLIRAGTPICMLRKVNISYANNQYTFQGLDVNLPTTVSGANNKDFHEEVNARLVDDVNYKSLTGLLNPDVRGARQNVAKICFSPHLIQMTRTEVSYDFQETVEILGNPEIVNAQNGKVVRSIPLEWFTTIDP